MKWIEWIGHHRQKLMMILIIITIIFLGNFIYQEFTINKNSEVKKQKLIQEQIYSYEEKISNNTIAETENSSGQQEQIKNDEDRIEENATPLDEITPEGNNETENETEVVVVESNIEIQPNRKENEEVVVLEQTEDINSTRDHTPSTNIQEEDKKQSVVQTQKPQITTSTSSQVPTNSTSPQTTKSSQVQEKTEPKIGNFSATLYGAIAWANQDINIRKSSSKNSTKLGVVPCGKKVTILSVENASTKYIKIKYGNIIGYVHSNFLMINLPDIIPDMYYEITNAKASIYQSSGYSISGITGKNLYGFSKKYNSKIKKMTYYAPLLYPVAKQLQKAYNVAIKEGYNLKIYDSYRPWSTTKTVYEKFLNLYNSNSKVRQKINYDASGSYWGTSWFLAKGYSNHNRGIAIDLALTDQQGNDLKAQSKMHTLDTSSVLKYNNSVSNKLQSIMTQVGFETLDSEWWHFEEKDYKSSPVNNFMLQ